MPRPIRCLVCLLGLSWLLITVTCLGVGAVEIHTGPLTTTRIDLETLVSKGIQDGRAALDIVKHTLQIRPIGNSAFTLWHPHKLSGQFRLSFECFVPQRETKPLILFHALPTDSSSMRSWRNADGGYDAYVNGMQTYTLGINRGRHSDPTAFSPWSAKGRYQMSNLRRLGDFKYTPEYKARLKAEKRRLGGVESWQTSTWREWNEAVTLISGTEPDIGLNKWIHYEIRVNPPYIAHYVNGRLVFEVVDKHAQPLRTGYIGFRTIQGKPLYLRHIQIERPKKSTSR